MNWDDIRLFLSVARAGSLSAAAPSLRLDPATLSRRIGRLERSMGEALFAKSPQGYRLTDAGRALLDRAEAAEDALRPVAARTGDGGLTGSVRIGAPDGCATYLLPRVCARIAAENPGLDLQILALPRVVSLSRREADFAIAVSPPAAGRLTVQKIADYHLHLALHPGRWPIPRSRDDLRSLPVVGYIQDMIFDPELDYLGEIGSPRVALASTSVTVQVQLLRQGAGVGFIHDFALPEAPELRRVLASEIALTRSYWLVRHQADRGSERLDRIGAALVQGLRAEIAEAEARAAVTAGA